MPETTIDKTRRNLIEIATSAIQFSALAGKNTVQFSRHMVRAISKKRTRFSPMFRAYESEKFFLKDRDQEKNLGDMVTAYETIAVDQFDLREIIADRDLHSLENRFREIYALEKVLENAKISQKYAEYKSSDDILTSVAAQPPQIQLQLKKFFIIKAITCYVNGVNLTIENCDELILPDEDLRKHNLRLIIQSLIQEAFEIACNDADERKEFVDSIYHATTGEVTPKGQEDLAPPATAPELYKDRANRKEIPVAFIRRVYGPWLGRGISRPHIKHLDEPLYHGLYRYLSKNAEPEDLKLGLPAAKGARIKHSTSSSTEAESLTAKREKDNWDRRRNLTP